MKCDSVCVCVCLCSRIYIGDRCGQLPSFFTLCTSENAASVNLKKNKTQQNCSKVSLSLVFWNDSSCYVIWCNCKTLQSKPLTPANTFDLTGYRVAFKKIMWYVHLNTHTSESPQVAEGRGRGGWFDSGEREWCSALRISWPCQAVSCHQDAGSTTGLADTFTHTQTHTQALELQACSETCFVLLHCWTQLFYIDRMNESLVNRPARAHMANHNHRFGLKKNKKQNATNVPLEGYCEDSRSLNDDAQH